LKKEDQEKELKDLIENLEEEINGYEERVAGLNQDLEKEMQISKLAGEKVLEYKS